jgi:signal transduction histidine kinase
MPLGSLRGRVWLGAILWTIGLFAVVTIAFTLSMHLRASALIVHSHGLAAGLVALICMIAGLVLVRGGLAPFDDMRRRLSDVRSGMERRLQGAYPAEVQPLVNDLNALLDHRDRTVQRALAKAGDLAHGLKTPLAVLAREAEKAGADGHVDLAATLSQQVERMRRQIEYHLAHARAAASGATPGARCSVREAADALARTLLRLHDGRGIVIDVLVAPGHLVRGQRADLEEMLGNLLENACQWARTRVIVDAAARDGRLVITVDDDGPGLEESMREAVLQRGVRADEAAPGSGLGLAIVRDLAELYGGSISLANAPAGGLRARLELAAADAATSPAR